MTNHIGGLSMSLESKINELLVKEPQKDDYKLLEETLLTQAIEQLRESYQNETAAKKRLLPNHERRLKTQFHQAQTAIAQRFLDKLTKEVAEIQENMALLKEPHNAATSKKAAFEAALEKNSSQIKVLENELVQKVAKIQVPLVTVQTEAAGSLPPPPPPPPVIKIPAKKETTTKASTPLSPSVKKPSSEQLAHSIADEIKKGIALKKVSKASAKPVLQKRQSLRMALKKAVPGESTHSHVTPADLAGFIDGFTDEIEKPKKVVKVQEKNEALLRVLKKIDAKEKEQKRELIAFAQMRKFIRCWGMDASLQIIEVDKCLSLQQDMINDMKNKLQNLEEAISLREQIEAVRQAVVKKEEQSQPDAAKIEPAVNTDEPPSAPMMLMAPPPPPPPPALGIKKDKAIAAKPKAIVEVLADNHEKSAPKAKQPLTEERKKFADIFSDPKFRQRAKQMKEAAEKEAPPIKTPIKQGVLKEAQAQVEQAQAERLTRIQQLLANEDLPEGELQGASIALQSFETGLKAANTKLQKVVVPDLGMLKQEHERLYKMRLT